MVNHVGFVSAAIKLQRLVTENETLASDLVQANKELLQENEKLLNELNSSNTLRLAEELEKAQRANELMIADKELLFQQSEKKKRESERIIADKERAFQMSEKDKRASELIIANKELAFQQSEKSKRASELVIAEKELAFQQAEKGKREAELIIIDKELTLETERGRRSKELLVVNEILASKNLEMKKRASELAIANKEKIELLAQLLQSQKMESLGIMAGGIAHDMNNILGAILSLASAHLILQPRESPTYPAFETIRDAATRGGEMVKRLLNFARQSPAGNRCTDLNAVILEEVRLLEYHALNTIHLNLDLAPDLHLIDGEAGALTHMFMNLCVNAVDAMPQGGVLTLETRNQGDADVEVVVADTGCGMTREILERAMVPFFTTKEEGKGTGLGLSIVYTTVKAHDGQMEIQSEPGQGTRILLTFPVTRNAQSAPPFHLPPGEAASTANLAVLIVDDDELILRSTRMLLEVLGHGVTAARSGEAALELLEGGLRPDLVLLDMNMPGMGGKGTLPLLRGLRPTVPVLLVTGRADQDALDLVEAHAGVTLLAKPFTIEELQQRIHDASEPEPLPRALA
jgi:signal transduction histidine kinase/ActR/RegA family two-component response regulator